MNILVTGSAGFIGYHLVKKLVENGSNVIGIDNLNTYYSIDLKYSRLFNSGINFDNIVDNKIIKSSLWENYKFSKVDIEDFISLNEIFKNNSIDIVIHLAAQAGVRYSLENPRTYINTNINGFFNIIELSKIYNVNKFVYASSSSVYGLSDNEILSTSDKVDRPASLYAATKKSNELIAHVYSHIYNLKTVGLRFFTVYGPWGRPDMSPFIFTDAIYKNQEIQVNNNGLMKRDFTYIDDIIQGIEQITFNNTLNGYNIFNIGNNKSVSLMYFIECIENELKTVAQKKFSPMQSGDVLATWANISEIYNLTGYCPQTSIEVGIKKYVDWYREYYIK